MAIYNQTIETQYVDTETGEVKSIETQKVFTSKIKPDEFYMTFVDYIGPLYKITNGATKNLLIWLCQHANYNTGTVNLSASIRKQMCIDLNTTNSTISHGIKVLKDSKLLDGEGGTFQINPQIFWKGELSKRKELLDNNEIRVSFSIG